MKIGSGIALLAVAVTAFAPVLANAAPASVGTVKSAAAGTMIVRGGKLLPVKGSTALLAGDKVLTRSGAASVALASGCGVAVPATSIVTIAGARDCTAAPTGFAMNGSSFAANGADALSSAGTAAAGLALIIGGTATYVAIDDNNDNDHAPTSN